MTYSPQEEPNEFLPQSQEANKDQILALGEIILQLKIMNHYFEILTGEEVGEHEIDRKRNAN